MSEALRKAAQAALTALENLDGIDTETECVTICVGDEIDALRAALAEPEQSEPVMHITKTVIGNHLRKNKNGDIGMYRNGFKDGVRFALEKLHKVSHD